ncbi:glycosyltransferase [Rhizobium etli]|uniref:glycosyltransferase n=1 Tax=Rhizobium etli TaxID=29449 RepID=UPI0003839033|nr:glycosyltransferase [Rhizobium etli]AGS20639.1 glycosyltransferase family 1 protein [Rhizobium etli bv. mimosae str. Mim1]
MRTIFILVPGPFPTGPIKGAYALANAIAPIRRVVLVFLKEGPGVDAPLHELVEVVSLARTSGGWIGRLSAYRKLLEDAGGRSQVGSISMCLSADMINRSCRSQAVICSSVRGNLPQNYRLDYGWPGVPLALGHLLALRAFDYVVAMTRSMAEQINKLAKLQPTVIGNFVDEVSLERYRQIDGPVLGPLRFVFVGSLSVRKQPQLVISAVQKLSELEVQLDVIGNGPLHQKLNGMVESKGLRSRVRLHGQVADPHPIVATADAFVLPSQSEGASRAALEALHLGVPCVLRNVDGNSEMLGAPESGALFARDDDLVAAMLKAAAYTRGRVGRSSLLPEGFRQARAASQYIDLLEGTT